MGLRMFFLGLAVWALVAIVRHLYRQRKASTTAPKPAIEDMVRCTQCGVHLPKSEALQADGDYYCCQQHRPEAARTDEEADADGKR